MKVHTSRSSGQDQGRKDRNVSICSHVLCLPLKADLVTVRECGVVIT